MTLRSFILSNIEGITETPDLAAKVIGYGFGNKYADTICTIILSKKEVKLGFYKIYYRLSPTRAKDIADECF